MGTEPPLLACPPLRRWTALLLLSSADAKETLEVRSPAPTRVACRS